MNALSYHEATKHSFHRFARSRGYLDWANQPDPFRRFTGAALTILPRSPLVTTRAFEALYDPPGAPEPLTEHAVGELLRCSMGLSAWKEYRGSRWSLRVNPSSGNLHPTEAYAIWQGRVCHYAPLEHALEQRALVDPDVWRSWTGSDTGQDTGLVVALTSILWREAWKYGERAFRYCQHDVGHALGALRYAAALLGWQLAVLEGWSSRHIATVLGLDREQDFGDAEREEPECVMVVTPGATEPWLERDPEPLADAARHATWRGVANRLSRERVDWPLIDHVAAATRESGLQERKTGSIRNPRNSSQRSSASPTVPNTMLDPNLAREIILGRRSALAFDPRGVLRRSAFLAMLDRLQPAGVPWDALGWPPHVHLALFVHRVEDVHPGIYAYLRQGSVLSEWKAGMRPEFLWEPQEGANQCHVSSEEGSRLYLLLPIDVKQAANRVSCDQDIAADGFFSLGMIARLEGPLARHGDWFYRRLFWECGLIGQVLYLEAEAAGARGTGIGCYYDDPVHELLGLSGQQWQSLYHFSMGLPLDDERLTASPGYEWDQKWEPK